MSYIVHWVWLGGSLAAPARDNIDAWLSPSHGFGSGVQPVLWVDNAAWKKLEEERLLERAFPFIRLKDDLFARNVLAMRNRASLTKVAVVNITSDRGSVADGVLGRARVPEWAKLAAAVETEVTDPNGLRQVASDIVRVAVLWHLGGAYWDLGDSAPGGTRFSPDRLSAALARGAGAPAVIPQVLAHGGSYRTENGIILTNPDPGAQADAKHLYEELLKRMAARYTTPDARTQLVTSAVQTWRTRMVPHVQKQVQDAQQLIQRNDNWRRSKVPLIAVQQHFCTHIQGKTTLPEVDQVLTEGISLRHQFDPSVSRLLWATVSENEMNYRGALSDVLGGIDVASLLEDLSDTVDTFTFRPFVDLVGAQMGQLDRATTAETLHQRGWSKAERFFGGNTKKGSWYSWKTRPGRLLIDRLAMRQDQPPEPDNGEVWRGKGDQCELCKQNKRLHHCRRCAVVMCGNCGLKRDHVQPKGSGAAAAWAGKEWTCIGCDAILRKRASS